MLKKLLKYELTFMSKFLMIYYIITIVLAGLTRLFFAIATTTFLSIIAEIFQGAFISFAVSTLINLLMRYWVRFRTNFYGDESYLTHTLPVGKRTLYASKVLGGIIAMFTTVLYLIGCVFIAYGTPENFEWIKNTLAAVETMLNSSVGGLIAGVCVLVLIQAIMLLSSGYLGLVIGHRFNGGRIGKSVLFGAIAYVLAQMFFVVVMCIYGCFDNAIMQVLTMNQAVAVSTLMTMVIMGIVVYAIASVAIYFIGNFIFGKGVNVD